MKQFGHLQTNRVCARSVVGRGTLLTRTLEDDSCLDREQEVFSADVVV